MRRCLCALFLLVLLSSAWAESPSVPAEVLERIAETETKYGVRILYGEDVPLDAGEFDIQPYLPADRKANYLRVALGDSVITAEEQWNTVLDVLDRVLVKYPQGFLGSFDRPIAFCLAEKIWDREWNKLITGLESLSGDCIYLYLAANDISVHQIHHEIWHAVEDLSKASFDDWNSLNPEGFAYTGVSVNEEAFDPYWFYRDYSLCSPMEDRATVYEAVFMEPAEWWTEHPHLRKKLDVMLEATGMTEIEMLQEEDR